MNGQKSAAWAGSRQYSKEKNMSQFTDYMQFRTEAKTLGKLRDQLVETVSTGEVPLYELPSGSLDSFEAADAAWRALSKPVWVMVLTNGSIDDLAKAGPAFHLLVEEDFYSWAIALRCEGQSWNLAVLHRPDMYREATTQYGGTVIWNPATMRNDALAMAKCLSVNVDDLTAAFVADGGQAFSALIGAHYEQMEDQSLSEYSPGKISFPVMG
jgi:hypothetical protein